jgi:hypothetical protein
MFRKLLSPDFFALLGVYVLPKNCLTNWHIFIKFCIDFMPFEGISYSHSQFPVTNNT